MSTNFYIKRNIEGQSEPVEVEHIGKRSLGWPFSFQGQNYPSLRAWRARLDALAGSEQIFDEYGKFYTVNGLWDAIYATKGPGSRIAFESPTRGIDQWEESGFAFCAYVFC